MLSHRHETGFRIEQADAIPTAELSQNTSIWVNYTNDHTNQQTKAIMQYHLNLSKRQTRQAFSTKEIKTITLKRTHHLPCSHPNSQTSYEQKFATITRLVDASQENEHLTTRIYHHVHIQGL